MTEHGHYRNAPIIEATISLGVVTPTNLTVADLSAIEELVKNRYSKAGDEYFYVGEETVPDVGNASRHEDAHEHIGYGFSSSDEKQSFRARLDSFDFSVKEPYDSWEPFRNEARRLWTIYREVSRVESIWRVGVRYINRIDIPDWPSVKLDEYLKVYPEVPDDWPSGLSIHNFFMQLQAWQEDLECNLVVNEAPARPPRPQTSSVRLDFDLFRERYEDPWQAENDKELWEYLERLRERKNRIFNESITDRTRRLIE